MISLLEKVNDGVDSLSQFVVFHLLGHLITGNFIDSEIGTPVKAFYSRELHVNLWQVLNLLVVLLYGIVQRLPFLFDLLKLLVLVKYLRYLLVKMKGFYVLICVIVH